MKIIDWKPEYYPDIENATSEQQKCFEEISDCIESHTFVDVRENDAYLYCYMRTLKGLLSSHQHKQLQNINGKFQYILPNELADISEYSGVDNAYRNFTDLYKTSKPQVVKYAFPDLLFADLLLYGRSEKLSDDLGDYISFCKNNEIIDSDAILATFYVYANDLKKSDYVDTSLYKLFLGAEFSQSLTETGLQTKDKILEAIPVILKADFEQNGINFLFRMYEWTEGIISGPAPYPMSAVQCDTSAFFNKKVLPDSELTLRLMNDECLYIEHVLVPAEKKENRRMFNASVIREAENYYRQSAGLQPVGEGWVSETLLFRQIEAAFPNEEVEQHSSPFFLNRQHYDVYLPKRKIALEYQGVQHFKPVEFFGGEEAFIEGQRRDRLKKDLSAKNGVTLIEVESGYDIKDILSEILANIVDKNSSEFETMLSSAYNSALSLAEKKSLSETEVGNSLDKSIKRSKSKKDNKTIGEKELDAKIAEMTDRLTPSPYADKDWMNKIPQEKFDAMLNQYEEIVALSKGNAKLAYSKGLELIASGYYAPAMFERMAIILRKLKRDDEELKLLLQMKRDFGYNQYDARIRNIIMRNHY